MKQFFNIVASACELIVLSLLFFIMAVWIKVDATGPVFYRQVRVGRYNKDFKIFKFRSMRVGANKGSLVTIGSRDPRDTCIGDYYCKRIMISRLSVSCVAICSPFSEMVAPPPATPSRNPNIQGGGGSSLRCRSLCRRRRGSCPAGLQSGRRSRRCRRLRRDISRLP